MQKLPLWQDQPKYVEKSCAWEWPELGNRQRSSHPSNAQLASEALRVDQGILEHTAKEKPHPVVVLSYVAEKTIPPLKEKSSQGCLWDSWAAQRKEKQSGDCPWRVRCKCYIKTSVYRTLFSARWVLFSLRRGGGGSVIKEGRQTVSPSQ